MIISVFTFIKDHPVFMQTIYVCAYVFIGQLIVRKIKSNFVRALLSSSLAFILGCSVVFEILNFGIPVFYFVIAGVVYLTLLPMVLECELIHEFGTDLPERIWVKIRVMLNPELDETFKGPGIRKSPYRFPYWME